MGKVANQTVEQFVKATTKKSGVPIKVKRKKVLLDLVRLLKK